MIKEIIESLNIDLKKAIIDNYQLKDGLYVRIASKIEFFVYKKKKNQDKEVCLTDLQGNIRGSEYEWFAKRDYLSVYLNSNKAIDPPKKKIHNNNYLTLFIKAKEFTYENKEHFIEKLYGNLKKFESFTKKEEKEVLKTFKDYIFDDTRQNDVEDKKKKFLEIFDEIKSKKALIKDNEYIKLFFNENLESYEKEANIYYALKIFNKIETVKEVDGEIYGLSDFNMGLNQKKPYMEHRTRGFNLPFMVKKDDVFEIKELFEFFKYQNKPLIEKSPSKNKAGIFIFKHSDNDQAEITDFDILTNETRLKRPFILKSYVLNKEDEIIDDCYILFGYVDEIFFNGLLKNNLHGDVYSKLPNEMQNLIFLTRDAMLNLKKGDIEPLLQINRKFADKFMEYFIKQNKEYKAKEAFNLKLSLLAYEGVNMNIKEILEELEDKINKPEELNENEFFVLSGQIIKYLLNQSTKSDKKADMIEPFLRSGKAKKLKQEIETLFFTYKHRIPLNFQKFNNALALIEAFEDNVKVKKDKLLVGLLSENIFYKGNVR